MEVGSIQGAARKLGLSRTALRRSLDLLESEIGAPLLHRSPTGIRLTPAGVVVLEEGMAVVASTSGLVARARSAGDEAWGTLRVIEPLGLPLAMHVNTLLATHLALPRQRIAIRQVEDPQSCLREPFELMLHDGPAPDRNAWFSRVLLRASIRPLASRAYLEQRGTPQSAAELADHDTLGWSRPGQPPGQWPLLAGGAVEVTPWLSSSDAHLLATVAARGGGIALIPRMPYFDDPEADPFVTVLEDEVGTELVFRVTTPFPHRADARTRDVLEMVQARLEGLPSA